MTAFFWQSADYIASNFNFNFTCFNLIFFRSFLYLLSLFEPLSRQLWQNFFDNLPTMLCLMRSKKITNEMKMHIKWSIYRSVFKVVTFFLSFKNWRDRYFTVRNIETETQMSWIANSIIQLKWLLTVELEWSIQLCSRVWVIFFIW